MEGSINVSRDEWCIISHWRGETEAAAVTLALPQVGLARPPPCSRCPPTPQAPHPFPCLLVKPPP